MKKAMDWKYNDKGDLTCTHLDVEEGQALTSTFELAKLFSDFSKLTEVQQLTIVYGVKQKLADTTARPADEKLTAAERDAAMTKLYEQIVAGTWRITGEGRISKIKKALETCTQAEAKVLVKLGLATQVEYDERFNK